MWGRVLRFDDVVTLPKDCFCDWRRWFHRFNSWYIFQYFNLWNEEITYRMSPNPQPDSRVGLGMRVRKWVQGGRFFAFSVLGKTKQHLKQTNSIWYTNKLQQKPKKKGECVARQAHNKKAANKHASQGVLPPTNRSISGFLQ